MHPTSTLRDRIAARFGKKVRLVVSTGYGHIDGKVVDVGEDFVELERTQGTEVESKILVALIHIVSVRGLLD